jgi:hypothetical protein
VLALWWLIALAVTAGLILAALYRPLPGGGSPNPVHTGTPTPSTSAAITAPPA